MVIKHNSFYVVEEAIADHRTWFRFAYAAERYPFSFAPSIDLEGRMYDFSFTRPLDEQIALLTSKKDLIDSYDINNPSPGSLSRKVTVSSKVTDEFSWGFSESLKSFAKITAKAGIPLIGEVETELGLETNYEAKQEWKNSVEKTFELSYEVSIPPHTKVTISAWYDLIKGIRMDYTATSEISGKTSRISIFDDVVDDSPATGEMIRRQLDYVKFDGEVVQIKEFSVITRIKGTMVASLGVRGQLNVDGDTVRTGD